MCQQDKRYKLTILWHPMQWNTYQWSILCKQNLKLIPMLKSMCQQDIVYTSKLLNFPTVMSKYQIDKMHRSLQMKLPMQWNISHTSIECTKMIAMPSQWMNMFQLHIEDMLKL